jgi:transposase
MQTERQVAREQLVIALFEGRTFQEVSAEAPVPLKRAMAYRLLRAVRTKGKIALQDGRHGHPSKLRGEVRTFLAEHCQQTAHTSGRMLQAALQERFHLSVSISQINRFRTALGGSLRPQNQEQGKKRKGMRFLHLNQNGKTVPVVCCYSPLPIKRASSRSCKPLSRLASSRLPQCCGSAAVDLRRYAIKY